MTIFKKWFPNTFSPLEISSRTNTEFLRRRCKVACTGDETQARLGSVLLPGAAPPPARCGHVPWAVGMRRHCTDSLLPSPDLKQKACQCQPFFQPSFSLCLKHWPVSGSLAGPCCCPVAAWPEEALPLGHLGCVQLRGNGQWYSTSPPRMGDVCTIILFLWTLMLLASLLHQMSAHLWPQEQTLAPLCRPLSALLTQNSFLKSGVKAGTTSLRLFLCSSVLWHLTPSEAIYVLRHGHGH